MIMANEQSLNVESDKELESAQKKELSAKEEKTKPGKYYVPNTDIYEIDGALVVVMDMPGVEKNNIDIKVEKNVLSVEGQVDLSKYENLKPVYTEYNVGHFTRSFSISSEIDSAKISAKIENGVLTLNLPKAKEAAPRRIDVD
jgi:HSP20 family molecular chaperone IbpA